MASRWDQDALAGAADALTDAPDSTAASFVPKTEALAIFVVHLKPDRIPASAPRQLAEAMGRTATDRERLNRLRGGLEACAARLNPDGAAEIARRLTDALRADPGSPATDALALALVVLLDLLPFEEAAAAAREPAQVLTDVWKRKNDARFSGSEPAEVDYRPTRALLLASAQTNGLDFDKRGQFVQFPAARLMVAPMGLAPEPFGVFPVLALEGQPPRSGLSMQDLVDLLKRPNCIGATRDVILEVLSGECGRPFEDVWDFVGWAEKNRPDLDLKASPSRESP
jgi:hypothetical protein